MALFDLAAAWRGLSAEQQEYIGKAAIALNLSLEHEERTDGRGYVPAFEAAQSEAYDAIAMALNVAGIIPADPDGDVPKPDLRPFGVHQCTSCGCTELFACKSGCGWHTDDLCSTCAAGPLDCSAIDDEDAG